MLAYSDYDSSYARLRPFSLFPNALMDACLDGNAIHSLWIELTFNQPHIWRKLFLATWPLSKSRMTPETDRSLELIKEVRLETAIPSLPCTTLDRDKSISNVSFGLFALELFRRRPAKKRHLFWRRLASEFKNADAAIRVLGRADFKCCCWRKGSKAKDLLNLLNLLI